MKGVGHVKMIARHALECRGGLVLPYVEALIRLCQEDGDKRSERMLRDEIFRARRVIDDIPGETFHLVPSEEEKGK